MTSPAAERFASLLRQTRLYAVTDDGLEPAALVRAVEAVLRGGVRLVQYRDKLHSDRQRVELGVRLCELVHRHGGLLLVNDRVDLAIASGADGAHVGQDDLPVAAARQLLGQERILGASASYLSEITPAIAAGADYLGFGAVFPTDTKPDAEFAGLELLEQACQLANVPVVGIGGISQEQATEVLKRGASGVAVVSALFRSADPEAAAAAFIATVGGAPRA